MEARNKNKRFENSTFENSLTYKGFPLTPVFIFAGRPVPLHVSRCQPLPGSSRVSPGCTRRISVIARGGGGDVDLVVVDVVVDVVVVAGFVFLFNLLRCSLTVTAGELF